MPRNTQKKSNHIPIILLILLVIAGGIGFYYFGRQRAENSPQTNNQTTPTVTPTPTLSPIVTVSATPSPVGGTPSVSPTVTTVPETTEEGPKRVQVYFSKDPESNNDFTYAEWRIRNTSRMDVATYALEQIIIGPSTSEKEAGLFTPLVLQGESNCGGKDFAITVDSTKKATVKFCKTVESAGVGSDARVKAVVENTLKQFSTVEKVVMLTKDDNCFGDMSGNNTCKN